MHRRTPLLLSGAIVATLPLPARAEIAIWKSPVSGSWAFVDRWSPNIAPGPHDIAKIAVTGAPYTITAADPISPARIDLTSPDATLNILSAVSNTTLNLAAGAAIFRGDAISSVTISGPVPLILNSPHLAITNTTLAGHLQGAGNYNNTTDLSGTLTLDNGTLHLSPALSLAFFDTVNIAGTGTIIADNSSSSATAKGEGARNLIIGPGITVKTAPGAFALAFTSSGATTNPLLTNNGSISAEAPGTSITIGGLYVIPASPRLSVVNNGTLAASNGGTLRAAIPSGGATGNLSLGPGGTFIFDGPDYTFDQPLTVPASSTLKLNGGWKLGAPLTLDAGTLTLSTAPTTSCPIQYLNSPTVQLNESELGTLPAASLPLLNTTPSTRIAFRGTLDLASAPFSLASVPGQWTFPGPVPAVGGVPTSANATIKNGTLSSAPASNDLLPGGGAVILSAVTVNFPLSIDDGVVITQSNTTFVQPASLSGTGRLILTSFSNPAGITATGGTLELPSLPASPGPIAMSGTSTLQLNFKTTLAQIASLPYGSPGTLAIGRRGTLDLQSTAVDLASLPYSLALAGASSPSNVINGSLSDSTHTRPIRAYVGIPGGTSGPGFGANHDNQFTNVSCSADIIIEPGATVSLVNSSLHNNHVSGGGALWLMSGSSALEAVTIDANLSIFGSATVTNGLTITGTLTLYPISVTDLTTSTFLFNYTGPSPAATIRGYLSAGRLTSSSADPTHRLGFVDSGAAITTHLTLTGDANLDGLLNSDDYTLLDKGLLTNGSLWQHGDFNYDGSITPADFLLLDTAYFQAHGLESAGSFLAQRQSQFGPNYVSTLLTNIPEPTLPLSSILFSLSPIFLRRRPR